MSTRILRVALPLGLLLLFRSPAFALPTHVEISAADGFRLAADVWAVSSARSGALLVHQCDLDRQSLLAVGEALAGSGIAVVSVDLRGLGESRSLDLDLSTASAATWDEAERGFPLDIDAGLQRLRELLPADAPIGGLGVSCGGLQLAEALGREGGLSALAIVSVRGEAVSAELSAALGAVALMAVAAEGDLRAAAFAEAAYRSSDHAESELLVVRGLDHGVEIFASEDGLLDHLIGWLVRRLDIGP